MIESLFGVVVLAVCLRLPDQWNDLFFHDLQLPLNHGNVGIVASLIDENELFFGRADGVEVGLRDIWGGEKIFSTLKDENRDFKMGCVRGQVDLRKKPVTF